MVDAFIGNVASPGTTAEFDLRLYDGTTEKLLVDGADLSTFIDGAEALEKEPLTENQCTFDDFMKVDMRVARVIEANHVEGADKLLQLTLSLGGDKRRNVFAGIKNVYEPEKLLGRLVVCCANLAPRKMQRSEDCH